MGKLLEVAEIIAVVRETLQHKTPLTSVEWEGHGKEPHTKRHGQTAGEADPQ